jgi:hypothetical protein
MAVAESVEGRGSREGTALFADHVPDTEPDSTGQVAGDRTTTHFIAEWARPTRARSRMR